MKKAFYFVIGLIAIIFFALNFSACGSEPAPESYGREIPVSERSFPKAEPDNASLSIASKPEKIRKEERFQTRVESYMALFATVYNSATGDFLTVRGKFPGLDVPADTTLLSKMQEEGIIPEGYKVTRFEKMPISYVYRVPVELEEATPAGEGPAKE